ncbi:MAG: hypothetical protein J7647_15750 [Cyanobacteria bacterium SBLK]|nr:hypothetical protein [Cyanobacteria bacterium SBLK]
MNISRASADVPAACDKSSAPQCSTILGSEDYVNVPLPGYKLSKVSIRAVGPIPRIYPPPTANYELEIGFTTVSGKLAPNVTAQYKSDPPTPQQGRVTNTGGLRFRVVWRNIPLDD